MVLKYAELPEDITWTNSGEALVHRRLIYPRSRTSIASADVRLGSIASISIMSQHVHSSGNTGSQAAAWAAAPRR
jgi:hypothetical protein